MEGKQKQKSKPVPVIMMITMFVVTATSLVAAHPPDNPVRWLPPILAASFFVLLTGVLDRWGGEAIHKIAGSQMAFVGGIIVYLTLMAATGPSGMLIPK